MKRKNILKGLHKFLAKQDSVGELLEILVLPQVVNNSDLDLRRSIVFTNVDNPEQLLDKINDAGILIEDRNHRTYQDVDQILESDLIDLGDYSLENNWRCRILREGTDFTLNTPNDELSNLLLKSYWRLVITRHEDRYFPKYNLQPVFYYPGDSVGEMEDFKKGISQFVEYILKSKKLDVNFDYVKFFSIDRGNEIETSELNPFGDEDFLMTDFLSRITAEKSQTIDTIYSAYQDIWS
ncbi:hypothetical protein BMS_0803 [Halobacteriovorax marinus SJ]|uniref:Uncharacterized protein n=1 Tax=Halobacteriovorax marinus (strain ATCC BAA-682 / DSM 15412 / SJ) TaxID=862908 RepID=E1X5Y4_HALMS|nr:hypothetical protein [Halobacteriovorax marinus]CBW25701.1 hypothetical protein BMS_0803 [Halobacteriovorax marinus SJ]